MPSVSSIIKEAAAYAELEGRDDVRAGYLAARLGQPPLGRTWEMLGYVEGVLVAKRSLPLGKGGVARIDDAAMRAEATATRLERELADIEDFAGECRLNWSKIQTESQEAAQAEVEAHRSVRAMMQAECGENLTSFVKDSEVAIANASTELTAFKKEIQTGIAMAGPITYWKAKATRHNTLFWWSVGAFVALAALLVTMVGMEGKTLMKEIQDHQLKLTEAAARAASLLQPLPSAPPAQTTLQKASAEQLTGGIPALHFLRFGILILGTTIGIWLLRFVARILLSNLHLKDDAQERTVMIESFMALMSSEVNLKAEDITLALGSIFRPATSGLVKDDGVPPGVWDIVTRLKGGGAGN